jgi:hypothetical protein
MQIKNKSWQIIEKIKDIELFGSKVDEIYACKHVCGHIQNFLKTRMAHNEMEYCSVCIRAVKRAERTDKPEDYHELYVVWQGMKSRCYNKNSSSYHNYGGRGIQVCQRWKEFFENFYDDMQEGYDWFLQIDRIDNNGDYSPDNCRWSSKSENCYNRRKKRGSTSQYHGVFYNKALDKWCASVVIYGTKSPTYLGLFESEIKAAMAYDSFITNEHLPNQTNFCLN